MSLSGFLLRVGCAVAVYYGATHAIDTYFNQKVQHPDDALCPTIEQLTRNAVDTTRKTQDRIDSTVAGAKHVYNDVKGCYDVIRSQLPGMTPTPQRTPVSQYRIPSPTQTPSALSDILRKTPTATPVIGLDC